jgi:hypothetical protein
MACEFVYGLATRKNTYRLNDSLSSLSQGLQPTGGRHHPAIPDQPLHTDFPQRGAVRPLANLALLKVRLITTVLFNFCDYRLHCTVAADFCGSAEKNRRPLASSQSLPTNLSVEPQHNQKVRLKAKPDGRLLVQVSRARFRPARFAHWR